MAVRNLRLIALLCALLLVAAACGNGADDGDDGDDENGTEDDGGTDDGDDDDDDGDDEGTGQTDDDGDTAAGANGVERACTEELAGGSVTMSTATETSSLDPAVFAGAASAGNLEGGAIYDSLMRYNPETVDFEPWVAESMEPNDDLTEWTMTLREGVEFGNGDPLTAEVVQTNIERLRSEELHGADRVAEMEVVDERTIVFTIEDSWGNFPALFTEQPGMMVNPSVLESMDEEEFGLNPPPGAGVGPFQVEQFTPGDELVLTAKDNYWRGPVCLDQLRFVAIAGADATYDAFSLGEIEMAYLRTADVIARTHEDGVEGFSSLQHLSDILLINHRDTATAPTDDVRVRRAIQLSIDQEVIDERGSGGVGNPTPALVSEDSNLHAGVEPPPVDPEQAAELVEEVKAETDWDGSIELITDSGRSEQAITAAAQLENGGFTVELDTSLELGDLVQRVIVDQDFELAFFGVSFDSSNVWDRLSFAVHSESNGNRAGYASEEMDALMGDLREAQGVDETREVLGQVQELWYEDVPFVNLSSTENRIIWQDQINGIVPTSRASVLFGDVYLEE